MNGELINALSQIERERNIPFSVLIDAIEAALMSAYRRDFGQSPNITVVIDRKTGEVRVIAKKMVVEQVTDPEIEITKGEFPEYGVKGEIGEEVDVEVTPKGFGRIAAQTAKQVIVQRLREAERDVVFNEFAERQGDILTGTVQRFEHKNTYIDLGKTEALLPANEQVPREHFKQGQRLKVYITEVRKTSRGPQIIVSRSHPWFVGKLFELEIPEIQGKIVEIKGIAREPGFRTKIAVASNNPRVEPIGACVGHKGIRVQAIGDELRNERVDIIAWSADPSIFITNALSPAKPTKVILNTEQHSALAIVPDVKLSLAIGKEGQNVRLAVRLTGWKIDVKSESQIKAEEAGPIVAVLEQQKSSSS